ncbi:hypothetical protein T4B_6991 [Trichinella pseudospiralis]|uniref:Uncharacterized protein n=2 Tax=Trichinella pseudospiralis TaxID=6337 RepID=A0A0V1K0M2_TRIPS|nr:hypothetical protein T4A_5667 [Trichinella pseudospiralis]KRY88588.1 hypothetical protein T4D_5198 [Trichinella pseudospiralis]KRZ32552.1 hypothetical protein T4B_6991 [Trichinella pseudospiralis]KRZ40749.1 hypothetical protein T4C_13824 [Trichinella pseudospiralis]
MGEEIEINRKKARKFPWLRLPSWKEAVRLFLVAVPLTAAIFLNFIFLILFNCLIASDVQNA